MQGLWKNLLCQAVGLLVPDSLREQKSVKSAVKRGQGPPALEQNKKINKKKISHQNCLSTLLNIGKEAERRPEYY